MARAEAETLDLLTGRTGVLRITTGCVQSYRWLPAVLEVWSRTHPEAQVTIVGEAGAAPLGALRAGTIDLALLAGKEAPDDRIRLTPLFRDELVAVVSPHHRLATKRRIAVRALADESYWGPARASRPARRWVARWPPRTSRSPA
jgi:LysR family transcriptional regulator for metE and metH